MVGRLDSISPPDEVMLDKAYKQYFKYPVLISTDVKLLLNRYGTLRASCKHMPKPVKLIIRGSIPFSFSNTSYYCHIRIALATDYPYSPPEICIPPNEGAKIVEKHPIVRRGGEVSMRYLESWNHKCTLLETVRRMQKVFNKHSPVYTTGVSDVTYIPMSIGVGPSRSTTMEDKIQKRPTRNIHVAMPVSEKYSFEPAGSPRETKPSSTDEMLERLLEEYGNNKHKLEIHGMCMRMWAPLCMEVASTLKAQSAANKELTEQLHKEGETVRELEGIVGYFDRVIDLGKEITNIKQDIESNSKQLVSEVHWKYCGNKTVQDRLRGAVAHEAAADSMMEALGDTFKRKLMTTKSYINYVRIISREKFYSLHERMKSAREL